MFKVGVIADTHMPARGQELPSAIYAIFKGMDLILHAGDIEEQSVLDKLGGIAPVVAVAGNMDGAISGLPAKRTLVLEHHRIGLIHGAGVPRPQIRESIRRMFTQPEVIIYGHTHQSFWGKEGGIYFMNPGSPTDHLFKPSPSVGRIEIENGQIYGEIIPL